MKYVVKSFHGTKELEDYLNEEQIDFDDIKIAMNHNMILLLVRVRE